MTFVSLHATYLLLLFIIALPMNRKKIKINVQSYQKYLDSHTNYGPHCAEGARRSRAAFRCAEGASYVLQVRRMLTL